MKVLLSATPVDPVCAVRRHKFPIRGRYPLLVLIWCSTYTVVRSPCSALHSLVVAKQLCVIVALGELFPAAIPCAVLFDLLFFGFIAGLWTRPMRNLGLLFQFEIAKALLESEQLRASGNASAAQNVANNPYLRYKELVSPRAQRYYVSVCVLLGLLFVAATAPYANFPEGCDSSNAVSSLESAKSQS